MPWLATLFLHCSALGPMMRLQPVNCLAYPAEPEKVPNRTKQAVFIDFTAQSRCCFQTSSPKGNPEKVEICGSAEVHIRNSNLRPELLSAKSQVLLGPNPYTDPHEGTRRINEHASRPSAPQKSRKATGTETIHASGLKFRFQGIR